MNYIFILPSYLAWHYSEAYKDILRVWTNFVWFFYNFFSIGVLVKTLFSPWQRIQERREQTGVHPEEIVEVFFINFIMRIVGAFIRTLFVVVGASVTLFVFWAGFVFFIFWSVLPALVIASLSLGLSILL